MKQINNSTRLFRIISLEGFLQLLMCQNERFVNPLKWDDTYEGCALRYLHDESRVGMFIKNILMQYKDDPKCYDTVLYNYIKAIIVRNFSFGQCWSLTMDSDAMWRIYNYNNHAVQIESSQELLLNNVQFITDDGNRFIHRIGKVEYDVLSADKASAYIRFYEKQMDFCESFFHKRKAFEHENEVRVLIRPKDTQYFFNGWLNKCRHKLVALMKSKTDITVDDLAVIVSEVHKEMKQKDSDVMFLKVNCLNDYISCVRVHPMADPWYDSLIKAICRKYGLNYGGKSDLYGTA